MKAAVNRDPAPPAVSPACGAWVVTARDVVAKPIPLCHKRRFVRSRRREFVTPGGTETADDVDLG
jgi:hypothetical protein